MFGYITPLKAELKVKDFERFKCYYCGLCCQIKQQFGNIPRMSLNYDMTFLALLIDGISPEEIKTDSHICILHPTEKKTIIIDNKPLAYASAINIALFYYKLIDDVNDDKNLKSRISAMVLSPYRKKFSNAILKTDESIKECLIKLNTLEKSKNFTSIDEICHPFSDLVGIVFRDYPFELSEDCEELRCTLYTLGYSIGKWIYLIDAIDDLEKDMKEKKFNPINFLYNREDLEYNKFIELIKPKIEFIILNCGYTCMENLMKLDLKRNKDILYNIIELGLMDKYIRVTNNNDSKNTKQTKRRDL
ncbi:MAG TPA: hypothetical protein DG753_11555 [Clostridium sp.]|nr:hypothetical protein [Clostridium sp.]